MKDHLLYSHIPLLTLLFIFISSCNAQNQPSSSVQARLDFSKVRGQYDSIYGNVHCGMQDRAGNMWFGTTGAGVIRYDGKTFTNYTTRDGLSDNFVDCIMEDKDGKIWLGTDKGACIYDGKSFTPFSIAGEYESGTVFLNSNTQSTASNTRTTSKAIFSMLQDSKGNIWFGTATHGVYRYDGKTFTNFLHDDTTIYANGTHENSISGIYEDNSGNIWFGSWSRMGAYKYDGKSFTHFSLQEGLCDDMISGITQDNSGKIWFGCRDHGACVYDGKSFTNYTAADGLGNNTIVCVHRDKSGSLWFGSDGKHGGDGMGVCQMADFKK